MEEPNNSIFFDDPICIPIDSSNEQMKISGSTVQIDEGRNIDPVTTAAILLKSRAIRLEQFREGQPDIDDLTWHILLDLMVSMNTGKSVTAHILAITHNVAMSSMSRYVAYLISVGLIDKNSDAEEEERAPLKLSASGVALTSKALEKIGHELVNF